MGNKGQSLVIFVLILPILFLLFALIFEVGNLGITVSKYENEIKDTIEYGLDNLDNVDEDGLINLLKANVNGEISVLINNGVITVNVKDKYKSLYSNLFKSLFEIDITYTGYKDDGKIIIKRIEG